jgi:outer membrane protein TolC
MPLFLRKERGDLQLTKLKIQDSELALENKRANIGFKINASLNEWSTTKNQVDLYTRTVRDFSGLLDGERTLFELGESSIFLVNARETGYINAQIKLIELVAKNRKAILETNYALGILNQ